MFRLYYSMAPLKIHQIQMKSNFILPTILILLPGKMHICWLNRKQKLRHIWKQIFQTVVHHLEYLYRPVQKKSIKTYTETQVTCWYITLSRNSGRNNIWLWYRNKLTYIFWLFRLGRASSFCVGILLSIIWSCAFYRYYA